MSTFNAQFPPPEWLETGNGKILHSHSVAVQTQAADIAASAEEAVEVYLNYNLIWINLNSKIKFW
jgi:hypothetical protein